MDLSFLFPGRSSEELARKTGVWERHIAASDQCTSDLAVNAARNLFAAGAYKPCDFDFVILCTQTPDFFFPATACTVQHRLGIPTTAGALDFNLGCSGYIYGLGLAKGLIETGQARRVLLITADTVSRLLDAKDRAMRALIGDAATATAVELIAEGNTSTEELGPFIYGTDGQGAEALIVYGGAFREYVIAQPSETFKRSLCRGERVARMNGPKIVEFSLRVVPPLLERLLNRAQLSICDIDLFIFHQASKYVLDLLQNTLRIPEPKFCRCLSDCGNTVASTIPIALKRAADQGRLAPGAKLLLVGFGAGLSWAGTMVKWSSQRQNPMIERN